MYSGGKASTTGIEISFILPYFSQEGVKKCEIWHNFQHHSNLSRPHLKNAAIYPNSETKVQCRDDHFMSSPSLVKLCPRTHENSLSAVPHPKKLQGKTCYIVNNSAVDHFISLKFCTEFKRMTCEVL